MLRTLKQNFFDRPTLKVARELLGKFLVRKIGNKTISGMITEVEAYVGPKDKASHASRGRTKRTEIMFGKAGHWYIYLIYGMHYCLNVVTEKEGYPAAILIRSITLRSPTSYGSRTSIVTGPGKVCRLFRIDKRLNAKPANKKTGLWIEDRRVRVPARAVKRDRRIGVDYAGKWKNKLWRFYFA